MRQIVLALGIFIIFTCVAANAESKQTLTQEENASVQARPEAVEKDTSVAKAETKALSDAQKKKLIKTHLIMNVMGNKPAAD